MLLGDHRLFLLWTALLSLVLMVPQVSFAKTKIVQQPVTRNVPVERSYVEIKYAIADYYWLHKLHGKRSGWDQIAVEATLQGTIVIHAINEERQLKKFTINTHNIETIGNKPNIRYKNSRVTSMEWVEVEIDPRFEFPLVNATNLVKWDQGNKRNGLAEAFGHVLTKVQPEYQANEIRIVSYEIYKNGFKNKRWRFELETEQGEKMGYDVSITLTSLFSGKYALNYITQTY